MKRYTIYSAATLLSVMTLLPACSPSPSELAEQNIQLHKQLETATNRTDSDAIWVQISEVETAARKLGQEQYSEYASLRDAALKPTDNTAN